MKMTTKISKSRIIHLIDDLVVPGVIYPCIDGNTFLLCLYKEGSNAYFIDVTYNFNHPCYTSRVEVEKQILARVAKEKQAGWMK
jgi:hypothetical protein